MKNGCTKYRDRLLEAALTGSAEGALEVHLQNCADCTKELVALRARREQLDTLLPLVAQGAEPSAGFRARVLAAAQAANEGKHVRPWRVLSLAGASAAIVAIMATTWMRENRMPAKDEIAAAEKLAEWRAPSDVLLATPGREVLRTTPKLGQSYLKMTGKKNQEE